MPIDFPSNPTNGMVYGTYVYDASITAWRNLNTDAGATQLATSVGLRNIVPTSVAQAGGSASANAQGLVTFTGVTSLSLNGVFSSGYESYRILIKNMNPSVLGTELLFRLRNGSTDLTSTIYGYLGAYAGPSLATWNAATQSRGSLGGIGYGDAVSIDMHNPANASARTIALSQSYGRWGSSDCWFSVSVKIDSIASYDGITLFPSSGTMTGTIQVFGYNS